LERLICSIEKRSFGEEEWLKCSNVLCGVTAILEFIHVGGTLAKHVKESRKAVAVEAWECPDNVKRQIEERRKSWELKSESSALRTMNPKVPNF